MSHRRARTSPDELCEPLLDHRDPQLVAVWLGEEHLAVRGSHGNVLVDGDGGPSTLLPVKEPHGIFSARARHLGHERLAHKAGILGDAGERGDQPAVSDLSLRDVLGLYAALKEFDADALFLLVVRETRLVKGLRALPLDQFIHTAPFLVLPLPDARRVGLEFLVSMTEAPSTKRQTAEDATKDKGYEMSQVNSNARQQVNIR